MKALAELDVWLLKHLPEVAADLQAGATLVDLQEFGDALGVRLPEDFLTLYAWHNGQRANVRTGMWYGLIFLPLDRIRRECEMWKEILKEPTGDLNKYMKSTPPSFVKREYANERWIPFAYDGAGNYLGIDLSPDDKGTTGQVINFGRDEERKIAVAPSIGGFVEWVVGELNAGNFNIKEEVDGGRSFNTLRPEKYHFLDSLAVMYPES